MDRVEKPKEAEANISIDICCDCPNEDCGNYINLLDERDVGEYLNDDHQVFKSAFDESGWGCDNADLQFECKECGQKIIVNTILW